MDYQNILNWFKSKPATKAAWLAAIIALLSLCTNFYLVYLNSKSIDSARDAVLLSINPNIDIEFQSDSAFLINTSTVSISDIRIHPITYTIQPEPFKVLIRNKSSSNFLLSNKLSSKQRIPIPINQLIDTLVYKPISEDPNIIRVIVITFRREVDLKRFSAIEIFYATIINKHLALFPIFSGKNTATSGPPDYIIQLISEIARIEGIMFKQNFNI